MPLETATYVSQLVSSNPAATDAVGQGDDHLRLIKSVLLATLPNWTAVAMQSTQAQIDAACLNAGNVSPTSGSFLVPPGAIMNYGGASAPTGWLLCDGTSYNTTTFAALFGAIGYTYGGSGSNFNVPDGRGRVLAGIDSVTELLTGGSMSILGLGGVGGAATHTLTTTEMPSHNHGVSDPSHTHTVSDPGHAHGVTDPTHAHVTSATFAYYIPAPGSGSYDVLSTVGTGVSSDTGYAATGISINNHVTNITNEASLTGVTVQYSGSGGAHNTVQPTLIVNTIIKA